MLEEARIITDPEPCPYLDGRTWQLEVRSVAEVSSTDHERELAAGVRRFANSYFRPVCAACRECVPLRVPVAEFRPSKSQRRVLRRNLDVSIEIGEPDLDEERLDLYYRFHRARHERRDWPAPRRDPFEYIGQFLANAVPTLEFRYSIADRLVAVAYVDEGCESLSSVYGFHDPELSSRSLGTFDILSEIRVAEERGMRYFYLGYWVAECSSMAYKAAYRPHELLLAGEWQRVEEDA